MAVGQLKIKLKAIAFSQTYSECALYCRELLKVAVSYIYDKIESRKPKNVSLWERKFIDVWGRVYDYFARSRQIQF